MNDRRIIIVLLTFCAVLMAPLCALAVPEAKQAAPLGIHSEVMNPQGEFVVYVFKKDEWKEAGKLSFDKYFRSREMDLSKYVSGDGNVKVRLVQKGGGAAHIDAVLLGDSRPTEVKGVEDILTLKKLSNKDFDVVDAFEKSIELAFPTNGNTKILSLTARVEGTRISETPFQFPLSNLHKKMTGNSEFYRYIFQAGEGIPAIRGRADMSENPFFKEYSVACSGHPSGFTYGWVRNDDKNLYVTIDFTPDDTMDGDKDYSKVYVKTEDGIREFKVSVPETKWGRPDFSYTNKVAYQHKVYDFKIPLKEIGVEDVKKEKELLLAFAAYGTASSCDPGTCPDITAECTGGLTSVTYDDSCTFTCNPISGSSFPKGTTSVTCNPPPDSVICGFTVTVVDTTPPQVTCPADITVGTPSCGAGEIVTYTASAADFCGLSNFECAPPPGSTFPVGTTTATCTATDTAGNSASCSFTVTVNGDTTPPTVTCPADITTVTTSCTTGEVVTYTASAFDACGLQAFSCTPPSGSTFPVGTTTATCTAADDAGNAATCSFNVNVNCLNPICRTAGFWGTHACPETITPIDPNDVIGTITGENCEQKDGSCAQNITQTVINNCGACIDACGEDLTNTALGDENSAVEALCVGPTGNIVLQLTRQLAATALNCCISGSDGTCAGLSIEPIFTACNSVCDARKEAYASDSSLLKGPITATIGSDTFDCIKALDCYNSGGVPTPGFCAAGTCSDNGALCAPRKLTLCGNPSTATCVPNTNNCYTRDLPLEDLGLTECTDGDGGLREGSTGSSNECYAAQNNDCAFLPAPFDPEITIYDCGAKVKVKGVGNVLNQGKECCDTRVNCVNDD